MINNDILFDTIDNGIVILDENLNIIAWNYWLEIRTHIKENAMIGKNICDEFSYINEKKLKRKLKAVLVTKSPSYYNVDPHPPFTTLCTMLCTLVIVFRCFYSSCLTVFICIYW